MSPVRAPPSATMVAVKANRLKESSIADVHSFLENIGRSFDQIPVTIRFEYLEVR
jgi:hypothetical protein